MAKLVDHTKMPVIDIACPHCQKRRRLDTGALDAACEHCGVAFVPAEEVDSGAGLRELHASNQRAKEAEQEVLDSAIALYRRNASNEEWKELNLDRDEWLLKFKYMGLDDILARAADRG